MRVGFRLRAGSRVFPRGVSVPLPRSAHVSGRDDLQHGHRLLRRRTIHASGLRPRGMRWLRQRLRRSDRRRRSLCWSGLLARSVHRLRDRFARNLFGRPDALSHGRFRLQRCLRAGRRKRYGPRDLRRRHRQQL